MNKRTRNILIAVAGLVVLVLFAAVAGRGRHSNAVVIHQQSIRLTGFTTKLPENGVVQRPRTQTIAALVSGNLANVFVRAGDHVTAGQLLATIDNPSLVNSAQSSAESYRAAVAHAQSATATGRTNVVQAQANLVQAQARLTQAQQDFANGSQSGLGYGGSTAADQRATADANLSMASTKLREARRIYNADQDLYNQKAISHDALDQAKAALDTAQVSYTQAYQQRQSLNGQLSRSAQVLRDNLKSAQEGLAQAQAALSAARLQASGGDATAAAADAARAASDYQFAADQAGRAQLRAPFSGTVLSVASQATDALRPIQPGDTVSAGQSLFTLGADQAFIVRTKVDEQDIINVHMGQSALVTGEDFAGKTLHGHVMSISPVAQKSDDPSSTARQIITTILLDSSPGYLRDGMSVDVDILTSDIRNAIVVPNDAIVRDKGKKYVFVVRGGIAHKQLVQSGRSNDTQTVIVSGLRPGDTIISEKPAEITDGATVAAAPNSSSSSSP